MNELYRSPVARFRDWMESRGYKNLKIKHYMDGEPYYSCQGAEIGLSEFLKREKELTGEENDGHKI